MIVINSLNDQFWDKLKINEIRKIASTHQREKILYIGIETDLSEIVNLKARFN